MRKLAVAALSFSCAVFLAFYLIPTGWLIVPAVSSAAAGAALALLHRKWLRPAVVALLFFSLGLLDFWGYAQATAGRAAALAGQTREIGGTLLDYPDVYEGYCRLRIRIDDGELPRLKAIVYDNSRTLTDAEPGERLRFTARISTADTLYGKPYDNYKVNGYFLRLSAQGTIEREGRRFLPQALPLRLSRFLSGRVEQLFPQDVRVFMKSLMLGDRDDFYRDDALYVSMTRAGLMHVVAVSGLHIAFLVGLTMFLFGNGRRGALVSLALIWFFVPLTGSGKAVIRAAFMQSLLLLAPLLRRENDPLTSLSAVLALVLGFCPFAAGSVSLQLSFAAMAGILCFFEGINRLLAGRLPESAWTRPLRYAAATAASSLSVMVFTLPLTALHFGYVPLLSILANVACLWAVSLCFCGGWIACLLSPVALLGRAAAWLCAWPARYIFLCARLVSGLPCAVLYMTTAGAGVWLPVTYALFVLARPLLRRKPVLRLALPALLSLSLLAALLLRADRYYRENDVITVLDVGQGQCIAALAGDATVVIDCGNSSSLDNAGALAGEYLLGCGRDRIDALLLTHFHADHADGVRRLMEMLPVEALIFPAHADDSDGLYADILACAERKGTRLVPLDGNARLQSGRIGMELYRLPGGETENERCLMATLTVGETRMLVTADATQKMERELVRRADLSGTDILIAGHHGAKAACAPELLKEAGGELAVISVGYNRYGHPAEETLERLLAYGYTVYRTDENGTLEIRLG